MGRIVLIDIECQRPQSYASLDKRTKSARRQIKRPSRGGRMAWATTDLIPTAISVTKEFPVSAQSARGIVRLDCVSALPRRGSLQPRCSTSSWP